MSIEVGQSAPDFSAVASNGETIELKQFRGKWVILYFYPRDNTPGCTREACAFRDSHSDFGDRNAVVIGCSGDSIESHEKFISKFELPFLLISDPDHSIATDYGVWREKNLYGKISMGIVRSTFLIDPDGVIRKVWNRVRVDGHVEKVLEELAAAQ